VTVDADDSASEYGISDPEFESQRMMWKYLKTMISWTYCPKAQRSFKRNL
jgi:hypothetical protein